MPAPVLNALSFDVEDYFMVSAFEGVVDRADWGGYESRVAANTQKILQILDDLKIHATFFTLGWVAERFPALVKDLAARGHEVACHGYDHRLVYDQTPETFRQDVRKAKRLIETAAGAPIQGYRAPSFSIVPETAWAFQILKEEGFAYDASLLPAAHARGGFKGTAPFPHRLAEGLMEFPMSTLSFGPAAVPFSGGGYFRLFPYAVIRRGVQSLNNQGRPCVTYFHPWEFDPGQPRIPGISWKSRWKHYLRLDKTEAKLRRLLADFSFSTVRNVLDKEPAAGA